MLSLKLFYIEYFSLSASWGGLLFSSIGFQLQHSYKSRFLHAGFDRRYMKWGELKGDLLTINAKVTRWTILGFIYPVNAWR